MANLGAIGVPGLFSAGDGGPLTVDITPRLQPTAINISLPVSMGVAVPLVPAPLSVVIRNVPFAQKIFQGRRNVVLNLGRKKRPGEKFPVGLDFTADMNATDSLASVAVTATDPSGADVTGQITEASFVSGNIAIVTLKNGLDGLTYRLRFVVTTAAGYNYEHDLLVLVSATA